MSHSPNTLKGGYIGDYIGDCYRVMKGDTRSLDYSAYKRSLFMETATWEFRKMVPV